FHSSHLTVNRPPARDVNALPVVAELIKASAETEDPVLPFMIWHASEPALAKNPAEGLEWLARDGGSHLPLTGTLAHKLMRRICDLGNPQALSMAARFLQEIAGARADGLLEFAL